MMMMLMLMIMRMMIVIDVVPRVAVIREEGSNGDREMAAALHMAGFEVWDVNMQDLKTGAVTLAVFRGVVFVGGFSYADVLGSAKGWTPVFRVTGICGVIANWHLSGG